MNPSPFNPAAEQAALDEAVAARRAVAFLRSRPLPAHQVRGDRRWLLALAFFAGMAAPHFAALGRGLLIGLPQ